MTEAEWFAETDFTRHIECLGDGLSPRKSRLLAAAFCRLAPRLDHPDLLQALEEIDAYVDGRATAAELDTAMRRCRVLAVQQYEGSRLAGERSAAEDELVALTHNQLAWAVSYAAAAAITLSDIVIRLGGTRHPTFAVECRDRVFDVVGNPFAPVEFRPDWLSGTATTLAQQMYESRDFAHMPILADALQDADCDHEDVLNHCRDPRIHHVRGCWVIDGVLGKE
jgi:hypothetical protein